MQLNELSNNFGAKKVRKRVGRGIGSGKGKTAGRGVKGQKSRSGVAVKGFEGGQMPIIKRLPKRGFRSLFPKKYRVLNISDIEGLLDAGLLAPSDIIDKNKLLEVGLIKNTKMPVKLLSMKSGDFNVKLSFALDAYSESAKRIVEKMGGQAL